ncbi:glycine receptor subunit alpha-3 [Trichonephila inaurata madagascariensis]|uniref:Glycine receptor subunit alpha-3 n=1 Tax=Trichonephila inaurata madagascariensis TaxID=2747483 RepID=A0A8X7CCJ1_9ARAC|nr:glycine receptor subunit alpha-3 [Trichonephila inaurata madagascariensis]
MSRTVCSPSSSVMSTPDSRALLTWFGDETSPFKDSVKSIDLLRKIEPLQFYLASPTVHLVRKDFSKTAGNDGEIERDSYTYLMVNFTFVRRIVSSIINTYGPSTLIVAMSWATFWLQMDAIPARVALSITSFLTICTQVQQYKTNLPPVSYVTAMDIWLFTCIFMVFSTLVEFAICYDTYKKAKKDKEKRDPPSLLDSEFKMKELKKLSGQRKGGAQYLISMTDSAQSLKLKRTIR